MAFRFPLSAFSHGHRERLPWTLPGMPVLQCLILGLLVLAFAKEALDLGLRMSIEFHTTISNDAFTYMASGRGILNGLIPYKDLLDVKAPGVIALAALSLATTGDETLVWILQLVVLFALPVIMSVLTKRETRSAGWFVRWALLACAFLVGSAFTLYAVERAPRFQVESFGVFFALLYLLVIAWDRERMSYLRLGLASFFLLCTVGLKEPFLFVLAAAALLLARDSFFFLRSYVVPLVLAVLAGSIALALLGWLEPYLTIDLPTILSDRLSADHSVFFRGIIIMRVLKDVAWFSPVPLLGYAIFFLWISHPLLKSPSGNGTWLMVSALTVLLLAYVCHFSSLYWQLLQVIHYQFPLQDGYFQLLTCEYAGAVFLTVAALVCLCVWARRLFWNVVLAAAAAYLVIFAIGSGDFHLNHYLQAVPAYAAVFLVFAEGCVRSRRLLVQAVFVVALCLIALIPFLHPPLPYAQLMRQAAENTREIDDARMLARQLDTLLDRCHLDRYYDLSGSAAIAFTHHSPLDLSWTVVGALQLHDPQLRQRLFDRLALARVVLVNTSSVPTGDDAELRRYLQAHFTPTAPACAGDERFEGEDRPLFSAG